MLPVKYRINKDVLPSVLKKSRSFSSDFLVLKVHFSAFSGAALPPRFAVVVSNKVAGKAVDRHLIKRRLHHLIEGKISTIKNNTDLVLLVQKPSLKLGFDELERELDVLLTKAGVIMNQV